MNSSPNKRRKTSENSSEIALLLAPSQQQVNDDALYEAVYNERWAECRRLLTTSPPVTLVRLMRHREDDDDGPLFYASWNSAPLDVVKLIYALDPKQAHQQDHHGWTASHFACWCAPTDVTEFLCSSAPISTRTPNREGELPLHLAVEHKRSPSVLIRSLLEIHPEAVLATDLKGRTPLDTLVESWEEDLDAFYDAANDESALLSPGHVDDDTDGVLVLAETLSLLLTAEIGIGSGSETEMVAYDWFSLQGALERLEILLPPKFVAVLIRSKLLDCQKPDCDGNFSLHHLCSSEGEEEEEEDDSIKLS